MYAVWSLSSGGMTIYLPVRWHLHNADMMFILDELTSVLKCGSFSMNAIPVENLLPYKSHQCEFSLVAVLYWHSHVALKTC